ncbi:hypothetical protein [Bradyrhizobium elkanii]|uniref:hypothetical protein n=1 Tax=Bradyrhizobium elkanii TaxID=29448 RepID=UPI00351919C2
MRTPKQALKETPKRLTPKPEVLRELYLLSGNNCAMPNCKNVIIDSMGVVVGHICHIEAAMPDGPRFNADQSNNDRRGLSNLVLMCAGHHLQIDSKKYESKWPVAAVRKLKADHEARFKGLNGSLEQRFQSEFVDSTESLDPTEPKTYKRLEKLIPECKLEEEDAAKRAKQVKSFLSKARLVPQTERDFMLNVINRAIRLNRSSEGTVLVHVDDIRSAFGIGPTKLKNLGDALARYGVGDVDLYGVGDTDEYHVRVSNPSDYVTWFDINDFCGKSGATLQDFVVDLRFGLLDKI